MYRNQYNTIAATPDGRDTASVVSVLFGSAGSTGASQGRCVRPQIHRLIFLFLVLSTHLHLRMGNVASTGRSPGPADDGRAATRDGEQRHAATGETADDCPVIGRTRASKSNTVYNVYNQVISDESTESTSGRKGADDPSGLQDLLDPRNNMPLEANQKPCPGQKELLSTERIQSNIPKGGTQGTWVYPSPQMFYNALKRKGKGDDVVEKDMESVVQAHNTMNELTWREVYAWEMLHKDECGDPSLVRFLGRPDDLSPLARIRSWLGGPLPFDRHDWYVDRCGKEVRYVIDFYFDDDKAGSPDAFSLVVRPAVDGPGAVLDRVKMGIYTSFAAWGLPCPVTGSSSAAAGSGASC
jgi:cytochrome c heme-lyase